HVAEISAAIRQMAAGAQEQSGAPQAINETNEQMNRVTQQNAAMVEETTAASRTLFDESTKLSGLIRQFRVAAAKDGRRQFYDAESAPPVRRAAGGRRPRLLRHHEVAETLARRARPHPNPFRLRAIGFPHRNSKS